MAFDSCQALAYAIQKKLVDEYQKYAKDDLA